MKLHKDITWNFGDNPKRDGKYLIAYATPDLGIYHVTTEDYTVKYGWGTCPFYDQEVLGQHPEGLKAWAEFPF